MSLVQQDAPPALSGPPPEQLVAGWLLGYSSANTRAAYRRDISSFVHWSNEHGLGLFESTRPHIAAWARSLEQAGYRPSTVARRLASVSSFYDYCIEVGECAQNPAVNVRRPRTGEGHVELTPALSRDEVTALISAAKGPQDRALVLTLVVLGLRVSEALSLDLGDVEPIRGHHTVLIPGKGGRSDRTPLPPILVDALDELARSRQTQAGPIFLSVDGRRLSPSGVTRALRRLGRQAELSRPMSPHILRATAITLALDAGASLRDVQDFARHADPRTTRRYDRNRGALDRHAAYTIANTLPAVDGVGR